MPPRGAMPKARRPLLRSWLLLMASFTMLLRGGDQSSVFTVSHKPQRSGAETQPEAEEGGIQGVVKLALGKPPKESSDLLEHVDLAVGCMLLGSIAVTMSLFYLVNNSDPEIRRYSWEIISITITIFTAVLLFQGVCGLLDAVVDNVVTSSGYAKDAVGVTVGVCHFCFWFVCMHGAIATFAMQERIDDRHTKMHCWTALLAHMAGFAAIDVGCKLQRWTLWSTGLIWSGVAVVIIGCLLAGLFRASDKLRAVVGKRGYEEGAELWDEHAEEAENDIGALAISFLSVQTLCQCISGFISHEEALDLSEKENPFAHVLVLCLSSLFFVLCGVLCAKFLVKRRMLDKEGEFVHEGSFKVESWDVYTKRWIFIALTACGMCFSWCFLYAGRWGVAQKFERARIVLHPNSTVKSVCLALLTSSVAFSLIFVLNWAHDSMKLSRFGRKIIMVGIHSLGILIGFSWEQSFDASVEVIAELTGHWGYWVPIIIKLGLAVVVASVVVPAWRLYIMRQVLSARECGD